MEADESDDETIEFDIEVVDSSYSISVASNSVADLDSLCTQKVINEQVNCQELETEIEVNQRTETGDLIYKSDEITIDTNSNSISIEAENERVEQQVEVLEVQNEATTQPLESESENQQQQVSDDTCSVDQTTDRQVSQTDRDEIGCEITNLDSTILLVDTNLEDKTKEKVEIEIEVEEKVNQEIPLNLEISSFEVGLNNEEEPSLDEKQELEDLSEIKAFNEPGTEAIGSERIDEITLSNQLSAQLPPPPTTINKCDDQQLEQQSSELLEEEIGIGGGPQQVAAQPEPCEATLIKETQLEFISKNEQVEVLQPSEVYVLEPTERPEKVSAELEESELGGEQSENPPDLESQAEVELELEQDPMGEPQVDITVEQWDREQVELSNCLRQLALDQLSEDLEWEFDNEPIFEKRHVEVKRNCDPRQFYELGDELGRGKFGTVYRCVELTSGRKLAAKFVHMRRNEDREDVEREVAIMSRLQHKRLLQLYDAFDDGRLEMCLITELVEGGELFERIVDDDFELTEKKAAIFMRQICQAVEYMHGLCIVHLDMKPENILCVSKSGNRIKLIDFGFARQLKPEEQLRVMFGTPDFAAPEVLAYDTVSLATDMWSVGVICYVLLSGLSPFMGDNDMETMANVLRSTYDFDNPAFEPISQLAKDFIAKLLIKEQSKRLKPNECLRHPWLKRGGLELEASVRSSRRESLVSEPDMSPLAQQLANPLISPLNKRNLKKYVVRRKWHKTVHAIMALGRMGANLKLKMVS